MGKASKVTFAASIRNDEVVELLTELKELIMGMKEDFAAFKTAVDGALTEIQADIEALKLAVEAAGNTPPEVQAQMQEITAKLEAVRNIYNPVTEPPVEPL